MRKFQITNNKSQIKNNNQNFKFKTYKSINMKTQNTNSKQIKAFVCLLYTINFKEVMLIIV